MANDEIRTESDADLLRFVAAMYALQLDQLAALLADRGEPSGNAARGARELLERWRAAGLAETGALTIGEPWVWASRAGLNACGLRTRTVKPAAPGLRHTHAVTDVRLAVERTPAFRDGGAHWRSERSIMTSLGFPARPVHVPDGEVYWPAHGATPGAAEIWAVEIEVSRKSIERTAGIMREILTCAGGWDKVPPTTAAAGMAPRYARLVYACSPRTVPAVLSARAEVGSPLSERIDIYDLPESALRLNTPKRGWEA
jgi:hypothetical protein